MKPLLAAAAAEATDDHLVAAVRDGSEEAFEALYRRYRPQIVAYVRKKVGDHARSEDIAQEAFMSALRGLRGSDQEIAFRPWMYEIAKNACIDHLRRAGRAAEVSIDSDDFSPQEEGRISQSVSGTDAEVARREELEALQMAFGDLPDSQHQILVMRELEGLSYDRIGSRMGLSRGAVESMLFRARRTLRDGFDEIDTGARCHRMHGAMEAAAAGRRTGMRERRRLESHLTRCAGCRRAAVTMGLDDLALAAAERSRGTFRRLAGLLPLPAFLRRRWGDGIGALNTMGPATEQGLSLAGKATAVVVAAAVAAGGAGVAQKASGGALPLPAGLGGKSAAGTDAGAEHGGDGSGGTAGEATGPAGGGAGGVSGTGGGQGGAAGGGAPAGSGSAGGPGAHGDSGRIDLPRLGGAGQGTDGAQRAPGKLGGTVGGVVGGTTGTIDSLTQSTGKTIQRTGDRAGETVDRVGDTVDRTVKDVTGKVVPKVTVPEVKLPTPKTGSGGGGGGGGSSKPRLPDAPKLPAPDLKTPTVPLPETRLPLPDTGLRLP